MLGVFVLVASFVSFVVVFFSWCKTDSLCDACSCSHVQIKRYRPCQKRSRLVFACNALGRGWWKVFPINQSDFQYLCCHLPSKASRHREWWRVFPINQSDFQYLCCHLPSKASRHREWGMALTAFMTMHTVTIPSTGSQSAYYKNKADNI